MAHRRRAAARAYAAEDKENRRTVILKAARTLLVGNGELPAVSDIASEAGLAKGTVYLYFISREEIFATLAYEGWCAVLNDFEKAVRSADGTRATKMASFWSTFCHHFAARPELLRLDALGAVGGKTDAPAMQFKQPLVDRLLQCAFVVEEALQLPPCRGLQLLMRSLAMTRGLWQQFNQQHSAGTDLAPPPDFAAELSEALLEYWRGAL